MKKITILLVIITIYACSISFAQSLKFHEKDIKKGFRTLSSPNGRFVFGQISDSSKDQYMLDTWT